MRQGAGCIIFSAAAVALSIGCSGSDESGRDKAQAEVQQGPNSPVPAQPAAATAPVAMPAETAVGEDDQVPQPCSEISCDDGLTAEQVQGGAGGLCVCIRNKSAR